MLDTVTPEAITPLMKSRLDQFERVSGRRTVVVEGSLSLTGAAPV